MPAQRSSAYRGFPMAADIKPGWSRPSTILFTSEFPANEKAFTFALSQASEFGAELIIFHAIDSFKLPQPDSAPTPINDYAVVRTAKLQFEALCRRAKDLGIRCKVVIRQGWPADEIHAYLRERKVDRVIMGAHSPGPVGKLLVGSVAEAVLRNANVPVCIVGPHVSLDSYRTVGERKILCDVSKQQSRHAVANFGAGLASGQNASLILHRVISPHERDETLAHRTMEQLEAELPALVPSHAQSKLSMRTRVVFGDPIEELLYQGRSQQVNLIVLGAQGVSQFAAISRAGTVYKILAYAPCPVIVLSPVLLAGFGAAEAQSRASELHYVAGVI
jgi:nucleotide-binding universal stress UspA family protein